MSKPASRFQGLADKASKAVRTSVTVDVAPASAINSQQARTPSRDGKKMVGAYYAADVSRALNVMAAEQGTTLQALLGEAIDDLMRKHGKHPFGLR